jgi:DHHA1 domain
MDSDNRQQLKELLSQLSDSEKWELILGLTDRYPWYQLAIGEEIKQGDILEDCPVFDLTADLAEITKDPINNIKSKVQWRQQDVIVMSQSCDMVKGREKLTDILLCTVWKRSELTEGYLASDKGMEDARRGNLPGFHVLGECALPDFHREVRVVDFSRVYSLPLPFVRRFATKVGQRIRLLPPYREQLAQGFARYFMRVGLPTDIPQFTSSKTVQKVNDSLNVNDLVVRDLSDRFKVKPEEICDRITGLQSELKATQKQLDAVKAELAIAKSDQLIAQAETVGEFKILVANLGEGVDPEALKTAAERLQTKLGNSAVFLASVSSPDKVSLVAAFSSEVNKKGLQAGKFIGGIAKLCGGGGGGRPNLAQAGGRDASKLSEALETAKNQLIAGLK